MPPKARITKAMILNTVMDITRQTGFETVNARCIARKLQCSTRPLFTCYQSMDELKSDFLSVAYGYYERYVHRFGDTVPVRQYLILPLSYIEFAREEPNLFRLLFISDMDLKMTETKDFYQELDNEKKARLFSQSMGIEFTRAKVIFLDLFLYTHGIAVLTATKKITLNKSDAEKMVENILSTFITQEKPDENKAMHVYPSNIEGAQYENKPILD